MLFRNEISLPEICWPDSENSSLEGMNRITRERGTGIYGVCERSE